MIIGCRGNKKLNAILKEMQKSLNKFESQIEDMSGKITETNQIIVDMSDNSAKNVPTAMMIERDQQLINSSLAQDYKGLSICDGCYSYILGIWNYKCGGSNDTNNTRPPWDQLQCIYDYIYTSIIGCQLCICVSVCQISSSSRACKQCFSSLPNLPAIVVTGGRNEKRDVETVRNDGTSDCRIPDLPDERIGHSMDGKIICGGQNTGNSCLKFEDGSWIAFPWKLKQKRAYHVSWKRQENVILMGGRDSPESSEVVSDYGSQTGFPLKYKTESACSIQLPDNVIVTGGKFSSRIASVYMATGWVGDLPKLKQERWSHACGYFYNNEKDLVYLVTGGENDEKFLKSTELLVSASSSVWESVKDIQSGGPGIRGISLDDQIFIIGGSTQDETALPEVYEFKMECQCWILRGTLKVSRHYHSISTLPLRSIKPYCFPSSTRIPDGSFILCGKTESNWKKVRHVPQGELFHPGNDNLMGTNLYGNPEDDSQAWSIKWKLSDFDEFLFISGNGNSWLRVTKAELIGENGFKFYLEKPIQIIASDMKCSPYTGIMDRQLHELHDPIVKQSYGKVKTYYKENNAIDYFDDTMDGGLNVYIRKNEQN